MPQRLALLNIVGLTPNLLGDATPNLVDFARRCGGIRSLIPDLPAVTCTVQSSILTGTTPAHHGIVGNGWFDRTQNEVQFWKQSSALVGGERIWDLARKRDPSVTTANLFGGMRCTQPQTSQSHRGRSTAPTVANFPMSGQTHPIGATNFAARSATFRSFISGDPPQIFDPLNGSHAPQ